MLSYWGKVVASQCWLKRVRMKVRALSSMFREILFVIYGPCPADETLLHLLGRESSSEFSVRRIYDFVRFGD